MAKTQAAQAQAGGATPLASGAGTSGVGGGVQGAGTLGAGGIASDILGALTGDGQSDGGPDGALTSFSALLNAGAQSQTKTQTKATSTPGQSAKVDGQTVKTDKDKDGDANTDPASTSGAPASLFGLIPNPILTPIALVQATISAAAGGSDQAAAAGSGSATDTATPQLSGQPTSDQLQAALAAATDQTPTDQAQPVQVAVTDAQAPAPLPSGAVQAQSQAPATATSPSQPAVQSNNTPPSQAQAPVQAQAQGDQAHKPQETVPAPAQAQVQVQAPDPGQAQPAPAADPAQVMADASAQAGQAAARPAPLAQVGTQVSLSKSASGKTDTVAKVDGAGKADVASATAKVDPQAQLAAQDAVPAVHAAGERPASSGDGNPTADDGLTQTQAVTTVQDPSQAAQAVVQPAVQAQTAAADTVRAGPETVARLASQIVQTAQGPASQFSLTLHPADLGGVQVKIQVNRNGEVRAALTFDNAQAAADVGARADDLKAALNQAGFDVADNGLSFNLSGQGHPGAGDQSAQSGGRGGRAFRAAAAGADDLINASAQGAANRMGASSASGLDIRI